jgi:hypothetical protein
VLWSKLFTDEWKPKGIESGKSGLKQVKIHPGSVPVSQKSARGLAQSKTLSRLKERQTDSGRFWTAPALWRFFSAVRDLKIIYPNHV